MSVIAPVGTPHRNGSSRVQTERELKLDYFNHVFADYYRLPKDRRTNLTEDLPGSLQQLIKDVDQHGTIPQPARERLDWGELATLEDMILSRQDATTLRRRTWLVRSRYERLVGPERYKLYLASQPPDEKNSQEEELRADLRRVLGATHLNYSLAIVRENSRRRVMKGIGRWTLLIAMAIVVLGVVADGVSYPDVWVYIQTRARLAGALLAVTLFGCLGAYLSIQRRLQESSDGADPVIGILGLHEFNCIKQFPLISGGLFALVLYFVLAAGFMTGALFPTLTGGVPLGVTEWSKLFIWAFLAGFAERLVPDTLDRLVNQAQSKVDGQTMTVQQMSRSDKLLDEQSSNGSRSAESTAQSRSEIERKTLVVSEKVIEQRRPADQHVSEAQVTKTSVAMRALTTQAGTDSVDASAIEQQADAAEQPEHTKGAAETKNGSPQQPGATGETSSNP